MVTTMDILLKTPTDDELKTVNLTIKKIRGHQKAIAEFERRRDLFIDEYQKRIERTQNICDEDCQPHKCAIDSLKDKLRDFAEVYMPPDKKSWKFSEGKIKFVSQPPKFHFDGGEEPNKNSPQLIDFLQNHDPDFIKTTYSADWASYKKLLDFDSDGTVFNKSTGEVIPNLVAFKPNDKFDVVPAEVN